MRAFTSLAGHILGSHPQINGYYEMHISYDDVQSLRSQLDLYLENDDLKTNSRYLFDKLLHNDYALKLERLNVTDTIILLALREPEQSIKSIVNLFAKKGIEEPYASPLEATNYYIDRITALAGFCRSVNQSYYYFDAELIQNAPDTLLPAWSRWLGLDSPLRDRYTIFSQTGKSRKSDSSRAIQSGKIINSKNNYTTISIPEEQLKKAKQVYRDSRQQIISAAIESVTL